MANHFYRLGLHALAIRKTTRSLMAADVERGLSAVKKKSSISKIAISTALILLPFMLFFIWSLTKGGSKKITHSVPSAASKIKNPHGHKSAAIVGNYKVCFPKTLNLKLVGAVLIVIFTVITLTLTIKYLYNMKNKEDLENPENPANQEEKPPVESIESSKFRKWLFGIGLFATLVVIGALNRRRNANIVQYMPIDEIKGLLCSTYPIAAKNGIHIINDANAFFSKYSINRNIEEVYQIDPTPIGVGKQAKVYSGTKISGGSKVACKKYSFRPFPTEIIAMRLCENHPNIINVKEMYKVNGDFWIVMELLDAKTLGTTMEESFVNGPLDKPQIASIAKGILEGMKKYHSLNIVHRDVNPENIMIASDGSIKIIDFGIAIFTTGQSNMFFKTKQLYNAPELISEKPFDQKIDIWSLGIIILECSIGNFLTNIFPNADVHFDALSKDSMKHISMLLPAGLPEDFCDFIKACLTVDHSARPSASDMLSHRFLDQAHLH